MLLYLFFTLLLFKFPGALRGGFLPRTFLFIGLIIVISRRSIGDGRWWPTALFLAAFLFLFWWILTGSSCYGGRLLSFRRERHFLVFELLFGVGLLLFSHHSDFVPFLIIVFIFLLFLYRWLPNYRWSRYTITPSLLGSLPVLLAFFFFLIFLILFWMKIYHRNSLSIHLFLLLFLI